MHQKLFISLFCLFAAWALHAQEPKSGLKHHSHNQQRPNTKAGGEAHGGNPSLIAMFEEMKQQAALMVLKTEPDAFPSTVKTNIANWIRNNKVTWAQDILDSDHVWPENEKEDRDNLMKLPVHLRERSAVTTLKPSADITFSFAIASVKAGKKELAIQVLLHESSHHLGLSDEVFIDNIVAAVYNQWQKQQTLDPKVLALKSDAHFNSDALKVCAGLQFAKEKNECLKEIKLAKFQADAVWACGALIYDQDKLYCLKTIKDRTFDPKAVKACASEESPTEVIKCLASIGVSIHPKPAVKPSGWKTAWTRNFKIEEDGWQDIERQADAGCGKNRLEFRHENWRDVDCSETPIRLVQGNRRTGEIKITTIITLYHCTVKYRCWPEK